MKVIKLLLLCVAFLAAAHSSAQAQTQQTRAEYLEKFKGIAIAHAEKYGIPASVKMAQGMLESNNGNSRLAREGNNHFGIKCKSDWTGSTIYHDDDALGECFRAYASAEDSWIDHSEFLDKQPRYQALFSLDPTDYKAWAQGLKDAGYATNPRYPEMLVKIIEDNQLYLLDRGQDVPVGGVLAREQGTTQAGSFPGEKVDLDNYTISMFTHVGYEVWSSNGSRFVVEHEGDTMAKLSWLFGIPERKLRRFNDMTDGQTISGGNMVYLQAKNNRSDSGNILHKVAEGETLHSISQAYGIKMRSLAGMNRLSVNTRLVKGQQLKLQ
jgi:hypothetical protein